MTAISLGLSYHLIQALRLAHAVMETGLDVHVPADEAEKFRYLQTYFPLAFSEGDEGVPVVDGVVLSHEEPATGIGPVRRPLVFPQAIVERCRKKWSGERKTRFSFCGLLTEERRDVLMRWSGEELPEGAGDTKTHSLALRREAGLLRRRSEIEIWASRRGRAFPVKGWDDEYFDVLARSEFVLCPNGDFVWTYRFFEAVLCGAIPVVERWCPAYDGFRAFTMADPPRSLRWEPSIAEENFALAVERLTVEPGELRDAALAALPAR